LALSAHAFEGPLRRRPDLKEQILALAADQSRGAVGPLSPEDLLGARHFVEKTGR
jgi:hypothetical protein